jgi:hypothetical protein
VWQGHGGNANRFGTETECRAACQPSSAGQQQSAVTLGSIARERMDNIEGNRLEGPAMVQGAAIARTLEEEEKAADGAGGKSAKAM